MNAIDTHGLPVSTTSEAAAAAYREGVALQLSAWPGAGAALDAALTADPGFALAHAARARVHAMAGEAEAVRTRIAAARELAARRGTDREKSHVDILARALAGRAAEALTGVYAHVDLWPRDAVIAGLPLGAFGLLAFSGMADHDQARVDLCARLAPAFADDDWWFLTVRGWALAENGDVAAGRAMVERALELRRANANAAHALAHALFESGAGPQAEAFIAGWLPGYDPAGILHGHLAWHAALLALQRGDPDRALEIYAESVQPSASHGMPINIVTDAASLLWRVDAYGASAPRALWDQIADYARRTFPRPGHAFLDPHLALIEAATGDGAALDARLAALDALVAEGVLAAGPVVPAIGRAARAFAAGDYGACVRVLEPLAAEVVRIGGSGAQREVVEDMLILALMRSGETERAGARLERRLHRKPTPRDALWRARLAA